MTVDREALLAKAQADRRRYRRVQVDLKGRLFVPSEERDAPCAISDMSPGGAQISCEEMTPLAETPVVVYIDGFGRFEGVAVRSPRGEGLEGKFGVKFNCTALKRERIAEQLTVYLNKGVLDTASALRRHERTPTRGLAKFTRASGDVINCEVVDLSLSGVSLGTIVRPPIGERVIVGQMIGRVVRHHETGIGIEFIGPVSETGVTETAPTANDPLPHPSRLAGHRKP
ncbi:MAG TPA: PilZ domain-containing protein [Rhizomicrobium sp.]|nr:PilZ domain-containing protein [Rhizomicrobium sp.]